MSTISPYLITLFTLSEISGYSYSYLGPKLYSQSLASNNRAWSNPFPYPLRNYQPSIPLQYYGRYLGDTYFTPNMQNPDYFFPQDNYPYSSSFDDPDYYSSNILYYFPTPTNRRIPYYDQPVIDPIDEIQDYDDETPIEDNVPQSQRDWWLEKNVLPDEDADFADFNIFDEISSTEVPIKDAKLPKKAKSKTKENKKPKNRLYGIDGFGRKKDKELVYGTYKPNPRRDVERTWVYGVPVRSDFNEDENVRELKSLMKEPRRNINEHMLRDNADYDNADLANWIVGNKKRSLKKNSHTITKENSSSSKTTSTLNPVSMFPFYNEAGIIENIPADHVPSESRLQAESSQDEPSVFDKIKRLLALEDKVNQQVKSKRSNDCDNGSCQYRTEKESRVYRKASEMVESTTMKMFPNHSKNNSASTSTTQKPQIIRNHNKRSTAEKKPIVSDEESLTRQLNSLRHMRN